jgi:hypothetical protein
MSATETTPARVPRKGMMSGLVTEYCAYRKVKPGLGKPTVDRDRGGPRESTGRCKEDVCEHWRSRRRWRPEQGMNLHSERWRPMSDHASSPRAVADPVVDITDMFAFPSS